MMLLYCELWPKDFEIEQQTGLLLPTLRYQSADKARVSDSKDLSAFGAFSVIFVPKTPTIVQTFLAMHPDPIFFSEPH